MLLSTMPCISLQSQDIVGDIHTQAKRLKSLEMKSLTTSKSVMRKGSNICVELMAQVARTKTSDAKLDKSTICKDKLYSPEDYVPNDEVSSQEATMLMEKLDIEGQDLRKARSHRIGYCWRCNWLKYWGGCISK